ncbi:MAG: hypothetical protein DMD91_29215 [Candidatus Rokuibacteriota bacterium]|nr:MAG: hypothetical protein DMD91_29215 [Candidatus Rokubacteria bacterium]
MKTARLDVLMPAPAGRSAGSPRVVALGGGTGLPIVLRGLKAALFPAGPTAGQRDRLTAIVTVADDGGSSGRLRQAYRMLAPGDIRNCLLALADDHPTLAALFAFRFNGHGDVSGHSLGNLILTALAQMEADFTGGVARAADLLGVNGRVLPATLDDVTLVAELADGRVVRGESQIAVGREGIRRVWLQPAARALPAAREAIETADVVVLGPGSLYTSLIPVLLVEELAAALGRTSARVVLVANVMTEPGETDGYALADLLVAIQRHAPAARIDDVVVNTAAIRPAVRERYAAHGAMPVAVDQPALRRLGYRPLAGDFLAAGAKVRHDPDRLAWAILHVAAERAAR